ncbi:hypothetical protein TNCV_4462381 [Trichonephila clavipes]|nr:hypothetical protein TNCV_4462381 [Trichonephila clavipes]
MQFGNRTQTCGVEARNATTRPHVVFLLESKIVRIKRSRKSIMSHKCPIMKRSSKEDPGLDPKVLSRYLSAAAALPTQAEGVR